MDMATKRGQLMEVRRRYGALNAENTVEYATDPDSPLHTEFEWDNESAGHEHRLSQARKLIISIEFTYRDRGGQRKRLRDFTSVPGPQGKMVYEPTAEVAEDPLIRRMVMADLRRDWEAFKARYERYAEFFEIIEEGLRKEPA